MENQAAMRGKVSRLENSRDARLGNNTRWVSASRATFPPQTKIGPPMHLKTAPQSPRAGRVAEVNDRLIGRAASAARPFLCGQNTLALSRPNIAAMPSVLPSKCPETMVQSSKTSATKLTMYHSRVTRSKMRSPAPIRGRRGVDFADPCVALLRGAFYSCALPSAGRCP